MLRSAPIRGALIACFEAAVAALRSRTSSGQGVCPSTCPPSPTIAIIVKVRTPFSVIGQLASNGGAEGLVRQQGARY